MAPPTASRLLLVHAHPDDETINNGATMARYVADGSHVTLVTCTRGRAGRDPRTGLAHLAADRDDRLGAHREPSWPPRWPFSASPTTASSATWRPEAGAGVPGLGMAYGPAGGPTPSRTPRRARSRSPTSTTPTARGRRPRVGPQVVVTYEPAAGTGTPTTSRRTGWPCAPRPTRMGRHGARMGTEKQRPGLAGGRAPLDGVVKSRFELALRAVQDRAVNPFGSAPEAIPQMSMVMPDEQVTTCIDADALVGRKAAALRAYATQLRVEGEFFALSNGIGSPWSGPSTTGSPSAPRPGPSTPTAGRPTCSRACASVVRVLLAVAHRCRQRMGRRCRVGRASPRRCGRVPERCAVGYRPRPAGRRVAGRSGASARAGRSTHRQSGRPAGRR